MSEKKTKTVVFIGGFAKAGKTTSVKALQNLGLPTYSTSALLHQFADSISLAFGIPSIFKNKNRMIQIVSTLTVGSSRQTGLSTNRSGRDWLIYFAEQVLVKIFGRQVFAFGVGRLILLDDSAIIVSEAFNREEYSLTREYLEAFVDKEIELKIVRFNVRSKREDADADDRDLLYNATAFWADGPIEDLEENWKKVLAEKVQGTSTSENLERWFGLGGVASRLGEVQSG